MYENELKYVKDYLLAHDGDKSRRDSETFRKRSKHTINVLKWAQRIVDELDPETVKTLDLEALYLACVFHDIGYGSEYYKNSHAIEGSEIWKNYADDHKLDLDLTDHVYYLIRMHSEKILLMKESPLELVILMEADWLDEEGAMSICWDNMTLGLTYPQGYEEALEKIKKYSAHILKENPLVTKPGRKYWRRKQEFVKKFINELEFDLFLEQTKWE